MSASLDSWASTCPRMVAQLAVLFDREAAVLLRENKAAEGPRMSDDERRASYERRQEARRLRDIACDFDAAATRADYVGWAFGNQR